jgi:hypothetical protein
MMKRWLVRLARLPILQPLVRWTFAHMSFIIPTQRLRDTETLIAFRHPLHLVSNVRTQP